MRIEISLTGVLRSTQTVQSREAGSRSVADLKRDALKAAIASDDLRISEALVATLRVYDDSGALVEDPESGPRHS